MKEKHVYILISTTNTKIGKLVRRATHSTFNHASVSFEERMQPLYSFGRFYHCMPFIGGLVTETVDRFTLNLSGKVYIKVFKVPVTEEKHARGLARIAEIAADDEYTYNLISAATFRIKGGTSHYKTYTCSEFVSHVLRTVAPEKAISKPDCKVVPDDFAKELKEYEVYSGYLRDFGKIENEENVEYFKKFSFFSRRKRTAKFLYRRYWKFVGKDRGIR